MFQRFAALNVTVIRAGCIRRDADCGDCVPSRDRTGTGIQIGNHCLLSDDEMVCRKQDHDGILRAGFRLDDSRRKRNTRRRISCTGFSDDIIRGNLREECADAFQIGLVRDDENVMKRNKSLKTENRLFYQRCIAEKVQQLLRTVCAAFRPETFSAPARHDYCVNIFRHGVLFPVFELFCEKFPECVFPVRHRRKADQAEHHFFEARICGARRGTRELLRGAGQHLLADSHPFKYLQCELIP